MSLRETPTANRLHSAFSGAATVEIDAHQCLHRSGRDHRFASRRHHHRRRQKNIELHGLGPCTLWTPPVLTTNPPTSAACALRALPRPRRKSTSPSSFLMPRICPTRKNGSPISRGAEHARRRRRQQMRPAHAGSAWLAKIAALVDDDVLTLDITRREDRRPALQARQRQSPLRERARDHPRPRPGRRSRAPRHAAGHPGAKRPPHPATGADHPRAPRQARADLFRHAGPSRRRPLASLKNPPALIITDSQVFAYVHERTPKETRLTSFSVLFAGLKGDIATIQGAQAIAGLTPDSRVPSPSFAATPPRGGHRPRQDPAQAAPALRQASGGYLRRRRFSRGSLRLRPDHPVRRLYGQSQARAESHHPRQKAGVPITNYGITIAWLSGILDSIVY